MVSNREIKGETGEGFKAEIRTVSIDESQPVSGDPEVAQLIDDRDVGQTRNLEMLSGRKRLLADLRFVAKVNQA